MWNRVDPWNLFSWPQLRSQQCTFMWLYLYSSTARDLQGQGICSRLLPDKCCHNLIPAYVSWYPLNPLSNDIVFPHPSGGSLQWKTRTRCLRISWYPGVCWYYGGEERLKIMNAGNSALVYKRHEVMVVLFWCKLQDHKHVALLPFSMCLSL